MRNSVKILLLACTSLMSVDGPAAAANHFMRQRDEAIRQVTGLRGVVAATDLEFLPVYGAGAPGIHGVAGGVNDPINVKAHNVVDALRIAGGGGGVADVAATLGTLTPAVTAITGAGPIAASAANENAVIVVGDYDATRATLAAPIAAAGLVTADGRLNAAATVVVADYNATRAALTAKTDALTAVDDALCAALTPPPAGWLAAIAALAGFGPARPAAGDPLSRVAELGYGLTAAQLAAQQAAEAAAAQNLIIERLQAQIAAAPAAPEAAIADAVAQATADFAAQIRDALVAVRASVPAQGRPSVQQSNALRTALGLLPE
jgi:hypothetical protein